MAMGERFARTSRAFNVTGHGTLVRVCRFWERPNRGNHFLVARSGSFMEILRPAGASSCLVEEMRNAE
jgi:hypothetical protein